VTTTQPVGTQRAGVAFMLTAVLSFQVGAVVGVKLLERISPATSSALRLGIAATIAAAIWRPALRTLARRDAKLVAGYGASLAGTNLCLYTALDRIPLGIAITVLMVGPIMVTVLKRGRRLDLMWSAMALAGVAMIARPGGGVDGIGMAAAAGSAVAAGSYVLIGSRVARSLPAGQGVALGLIVAALITLIPGIASAGDEVLHPIVFGMALVVAVFTAVVPHSCELASLKRVPARVFGVLSSLEPAVAAVFGFVFLHQALPALGIAGIGCVVGAAAGVSLLGGSEEIAPVVA
jgi:inner membrane transporter RhtA